MSDKNSRNRSNKAGTSIKSEKEEKEPKEEAIIGIDPGTTTAYAIVGIKKNIIKIGSSKNFGIGRLIMETTAKANPVAVCSDKKDTPKAVEKYSSKTGAKIISLKKDLTTEEKRSIIRDYEKKSKKSIILRNDHEKDALASALFGYKKLSALIKKLSSFEKNSRAKSSGELSEIRRMVIRQGIAIKHAEDIIRNAGKKPAAITNQKPAQTEQKKKDRKTSELNALKQENRELKRAIAKRDIKIIALKKKLSRQRSAIEDKIEKRTRALSNNVRKAYKKLEEQEKEIKRLIKEKRKIIEILKSADRYVIIKKLKSIKDAAEKIGSGEIAENDYIFIEDPSSISRKSIERLKKTTSSIVVKKENKELSKSFIVINISKIAKKADTKDIIEEESIVMIKKPLFRKLKEDAIKSSDILAKIIDEYKESKNRANQ